MICRFLRLGALLAMLVAGQANAGGQTNITLHVGDQFIVAGTDLACGTQVGTAVLKGQKLVTCFKVKRGRLAAKSYVAALGSSGRVVVAPVKANGSIDAPVFNRKPAALAGGAKEITVHAGNTLHLAGTDLGCAINKDAAGVYPTCFRFTAKGGRPGSYAFAETEKFVAVVQYDATGKKTKVVFRRTQA